MGCARRQGEALEGLWRFWYSLFDFIGFGGEWSGDDHDVGAFVCDGELCGGLPAVVGPKPYADLTKTAECKGSSINDEKALCVFVHQMEDKNVDGLKALASKNEQTDTLFFYATEDSGIAEQVVRLCDIKPPKGEATLVLLDLDDDGAYYLANTSDVSEAALATFLKEPGPRQQLKSP